MRLLVLYEELAVYFLECINEFSKRYDAQIFIFRKEVNLKEAPFKFADYPNITFVDRDQFSAAQSFEKVAEISPDAILVGGWSNKIYLEICSIYSNKIPVILGFDNKWEGTLKQRIASLISRFYIQPRFSACYVPGEMQAQFARKLGFKDSKIYKNAYCCDYPFFHSIYEKTIEEKQTKFPHVLIYSGRYVAHKNLSMLCEVFLELKSETPNDWQLYCIGTGPEKPVVGEDIRHLGFIQPRDMPEIMREGGVFVLPSAFEPWGVVVHEYAAAGFPLICSSAVGAAEVFLENEANGYVFISNDRNDLKRAIKKIVDSSDERLIKMAEESSELGGRITTATWADTLNKIIVENVRN